MISNTAEKILDCAHALIVEVGYSGFSYAGIADRMAISKPSIHHHFPIKARLVLQVVQRYRQKMKAAMDAEAHIASDPARQLTAYVGYWTASVADSSMPFCVCAMLAAERSNLPTEVRNAVSGHFQMLTAWLEGILTNGAANGQFVLRQSVELEARGFMALIHGGMLSARALENNAVFSVIAQAGIASLKGETACGLRTDPHA